MLMPIPVKIQLVLFVKVNAPEYSADAELPSPVTSQISGPSGVTSIDLFNNNFSPSG